MEIEDAKQVKLSKEFLKELVKQEVEEGRLIGQGNAKNIAADMNQLAKTLQLFDMSSLDDPRFADAADCLEKAWDSLRTAGDDTLSADLENDDGECPKDARMARRLEECGEMVTDEPMPMPGPPPEGACGMEPAFDDHEGHMAKSQLFNLVKDSNDLVNMLGDQDQLPSWVQAKITKAVDYLGAVKQYLEYERVSPRQPVHENKISRRRLVAIVKEEMSAD